MIPAYGPAITRRDRKALQLAHHDIASRGGSINQRYCFGKHHHQQRALTLHQRGDFFYLLEQPKKLGVWIISAATSSVSFFFKSSKSSRRFWHTRSRQRMP